MTAERVQRAERSADRIHEERIDMRSRNRFGVCRRWLGRRLQRALLAAFALLPLFSGGCAVLTNPVGEGIPVSRLPPEILGPSRDGLKTIPLTFLRQTPVKQHLIGPGDTLGIYIDGILGERGQPIPVPQRVGTESASTQPGIGYPIVVSEDGKIELPYIEPLDVNKKTLPEVRDAIREAYLGGPNPKLVRGQERILVSLIQPRKYRIQVVREDANAITFNNGAATSSRRSYGQTLELPAYENDVLNAIDRTGGLPNLDAVNEIRIEHSIPGVGTKIIQIPTRMRIGEKIPFTQDDVILENGDIVFIAARDTEVYYVTGLISSRQIVLPRDYDLRAIQAVAVANGPILNAAVNGSNLSGTLLNEGLGNSSPSALSIVRTTKDYGTVVIKVDFNKAFVDARENIIIQPGDILTLQETVGEASTRYIGNNYTFSIDYVFALSKRVVGTLFGKGP
jgi:protein involved in polysaccharide export with SLBB domain